MQKATILAVLFLTTSGFGQWHYLSGGAFNGISSVEDRVWIVGQGGLFLQSYDNGETWLRVQRFTHVDLLDVEFWDANTGLAITGDNTAFRTTNAGATWDTVPFPCRSRCLRYVSRSVVWATGGSGIPCLSTDGGLTWIPRSGGPSVSFVDSLNGWWATGAGRYVDVRKSTNGGRGWELVGRIELLNGEETYVKLLHFSSETRGICAWLTYYYRSSVDQNIDITTDGGVTWRGLVLPWAYRADDAGSGDIFALRQRSCSRVSDTVGTSVEFGFDETLNDVSVSRGRSYWVCGDGGSIWRSDDCGRSWSEISVSVGDMVRKVAFFDTAVGLAMCEQAVYRTTDAGRTWAECLLSTQYVGRGFVGLALSATERAFVSYDKIGWDSYLQEAHGWIAIFRTTDAGRNWTPVHSRSLSTHGYAPFAQGLTFSDSLHGWHPGISPGENSIRTTDGGETWHEMPGIGFLAPPGFDWLDPCFPATDTGWVAGYHLWQSCSGGDAWSVLGPGGSCITMLNTQFGWKAHHDSLWRTSDGGLGWEYVPVPLGVRAIAFASDVHGVCVGANGLILRTGDGGEIWVQDTCRYNSDLTAVYMLDSTRIWAAGEHGLVLGYGGWAQGQTDPATSGRLLQPVRLHVRPNPCRDYVILTCDRILHGRLEIRDAAGRCVQCVALPVGRRSARVDLRGLPAGVYFIRPEDESSPIRKVIVQR
jgi:photosystem II stability/assembly factor-like uncharacterized protein